jgi:hypothetical protein
MTLRIWGAVLACLLLAGCGARAATGETPRDITVAAAPVPLDPSDPSRTRVGALTYAGGVHLTSADSAAFGGFSGIAVRPDGRFLSQSDVGWLLAGRIVTDEAGRLKGVEKARLTPLLDPQGRRFTRKVLADAEDITFLSDPKRPNAFAISFEGDVDKGRSRVSIYDGPDAPERVIYRAQWADTVFRLSANESFEAITQCPGESRFLLGSEAGQIAALNPATGRVENRNLIAPPPETFKLTGLDCSPGGRLFAVYRAYDPIRRWRTLIAALSWAPSPKGPVLLRRELARLDGGMTRDNMEGIAAVERPDGGFRLYLISDDNFGDLPEILVGRQRTLLLAFDWTGEAQPR